MVVVVICCLLRGFVVLCLELVGYVCDVVSGVGAVGCFGCFVFIWCGFCYLVVRCEYCLVDVV